MSFVQSMQKESNKAVSSKESRRPFSISLLTGLILLVALSGFVRMYQTIVQWSYLSTLKMVSPAYILATGLFWGLFGLATGLLLWLRWSQSSLLASAFLISFSIYFWIDRIFVAVSSERFTNWPFRLVVNLLVLAWAVWVVNRPKARSYFEQDDDQTGMG
jgi:uncharacterized membrane protein HdeD (DUF308 family)